MGNAADPVDYGEIAAAIELTGMFARGGFLTGPADSIALPDGTPAVAVVMVGNAAGPMWQRFRAAQPPGPHPLDTWTRATLRPIAAAFGAAFVHPGDEPFRPFQRWAQRAEAVWPSPIGLLIHRRHGLWHAYRGALLFDRPVTGLPVAVEADSPCTSCVGQPCLSACPVEAFAGGGYDDVACSAHVRSDRDPDCLHLGCAARRACPVGADRVYGPDQIEFHMRAFAGGAAGPARGGHPV